MAITYAELLERQHQSRPAFGRMLLNWRRRNGWTKYTACNWAKEVGFEMISYGNLSVIEQGKAGELRQKVFWQLGELNRRIDAKEWGKLLNKAIKQKLKGAVPLGDTTARSGVHWSGGPAIVACGRCQRLSAPRRPRPLASAGPLRFPANGETNCAGWLTSVSSIPAMPSSP